MLPGPSDYFCSSCICFPHGEEQLILDHCGPLGKGVSIGGEIRHPTAEGEPLCTDKTEPSPRPRLRICGTFVVLRALQGWSLLCICLGGQTTFRGTLFSSSDSSFGDRVSSCSPGWFGTHYVDWAGLKSTEIHLALLE